MLLLFALFGRVYGGFLLCVLSLLCCYMLVLLCFAKHMGGLLPCVLFLLCRYMLVLFFCVLPRIWGGALALSVVLALLSIVMLCRFAEDVVAMVIECNVMNVNYV